MTEQDSQEREPLSGGHNNQLFQSVSMDRLDVLYNFCYTWLQQELEKLFIIHAQWCLSDYFSKANFKSLGFSETVPMSGTGMSKASWRNAMDFSHLGKKYSYFLLSL